FISRVSGAGLVLGVALLVLVLSVMDGFDRELRERILSLVPHATVQAPEPIGEWQGLVAAVEAHPQVLAAAPYSDMQGLLMHRGKVTPAFLHGLDPAAERRISTIERFAGEGALDTLAGGDAILLSRTLASAIDAAPGDALVLLMPDVNPQGQVIPRTRRVRLAATFSTGTEVDNMLALASLELVSGLKGHPGAVQGVRFQVRDLFAAPVVRREVEMGLGGSFRGIDWTRTHGNLHEAIRMSRNLVGVLLFLIVAVAAFNVVSTLFLIVKDKEGDIAILRTLGASPASIMAVFVVQGTLIGLTGTALGAGAGALLSLVVTDAVSALESLLGIRFLQSSVYPVDYLPAELSLHNVLRVASVALAMSFAATIYPAWRAARMQPADVLRYE
ncbi:MAG: lipoprotein-releasing ABC transporter permease subunit, partial [Gammaproteobacteria bacterium]